jgi:hypothetical protein
VELFFETKKPASLIAGGLRIPDLWGRLVQAATVRRHGMSMMVVMAVMMADLHLLLP